jgi:hypothetical protein
MSSFFHKEFRGEIVSGTTDKEVRADGRKAPAMSNWQDSNFRPLGRLIKIPNNKKSEMTVGAGEN